MTTIHMDQFGGLLPAVDRRSLKKVNSTIATNVVATDGALRSLRAPKEIRQEDYDIKSIALVRPHSGECHGLKTWDTCVKPVLATAPGCSGRDMLLIHRADKRLCWVDPDDQTDEYPAWVDGPQLPPIPSIVSVGVATQDDRSYTYTYVDRFGVESTPADPSTNITVGDDGVVEVSLPGPAPTNAVTMRIYRTVSSLADGREIPNELEAYYQLVEEVPVAASYTDDKPMCDMCMGTLMTDEDCPPPDMCCVVHTESGYLVGFDGNNLYMSGRHQTHNWPMESRLVLPDKITGVVSNGDVVYVVTQGVPYHVKVAYTPETDVIEPQPYDEPYPCIAPATLVACPAGAMYASTRGMVLLTPQRPAVLVSKDRIPEKDWHRFAPNLGAWYKGSYYGFKAPSRGGFIFEFNEPSEGFIGLGDLVHHTVDASDVHVGYDDRLYIAQGDRLLSWGKGQRLKYQWRSRVVMAQGNTSFVALRLKGDYGLPVDVRIWADGVLIFDCPVEDKCKVRIPRYGRAQEYQIELCGDTPIYDFKMATSTTELFEGGL